MFTLSNIQGSLQRLEIAGILNLDFHPKPEWTAEQWLTLRKAVLQARDSGWK